MSSDDDTSPRFHRGITLFLALCVCLIACCQGSASTIGRVLHFEHPAETAQGHFERTLEIADALETEPEWIRRPLELFLGRARPVLGEAIDAYEEVVELQKKALRDPTPPAPATPDAKDAKDAPRSAPTSTGFACAPSEIELEPRDTREKLVELLARLAILEGEAERPDDALATAARVERLGAPELASAIEHAYRRLAPNDAKRFDEFHLDALTPGWAKERLELRLAARTKDAARLAALEETRASRTRELARHGRDLVTCLFVPLALGLVALLAWLLRNRPALPASSASVPPEWSFEDGFAVLMRSIAFGIAIVVLVFTVQAKLAPWMVSLVPLVLVPLPMFVLIQRGLIAPRVLSFVRAMGLDAFPGGAWRWGALALGIFAADQLGGALILELCGRIGAGLHWTELARQDLVALPKASFAVDAVLGSTWFPFAVEVFARGLLFLTLRARMPATSAALWSAALVAAFQNASLPSFCAFLWSGFLFAWTFEHARSIVPALVAQCLGYAGVYASIGLLYR